MEGVGQERDPWYQGQGLGRNFNGGVSGNGRKVQQLAWNKVREKRDICLVLRYRN